jgi:thiol:disulfide interchange protein
MQTNFIRGTLAGACLLAFAGTAHGQTKISWAKSFSSAMAQARTSHKLVMADFYTDW